MLGAALLLLGLGQGVDVLDVFQVAGVGSGPDDEADPALLLLPGAGHQAAGGVVQDGAHVDLDVARVAVDGGLQQGDDVLAFDTTAVEALRPVDENSL